MVDLSVLSPDQFHSLVNHFQLDMTHPSQVQSQVQGGMAPQGSVTPDGTYGNGPGAGFTPQDELHDFGPIK